MKGLETIHILRQHIRLLRWVGSVKFIYSKKTKMFCEIFTLLLFYVVPVKIKVKISQNLWPSQNI
jgi:hypothetical protein